MSTKVFQGLNIKQETPVKPKILFSENQPIDDCSSPKLEHPRKLRGGHKAFKRGFTFNKYITL